LEEGLFQPESGVRPFCGVRPVLIHASAAARPQSVHNSSGVLTRATLGLVAKGRMRVRRQPVSTRFR
jgi:hypothetical protein